MVATSGRVVTAAVVQTASARFELNPTLQRARDLAAEAAQRGARIAVFPEAFIGGYPKGLDFGTRVGTRSPEGREAFRQYFEAAIEVPGPATQTLGEIAAEFAITLVVGVIERWKTTLYCTALYFGPNGDLLGRHRKLVPTALERVIWGRGDGSTIAPVETPVGVVGAAICWENYMPLLRASLYRSGVEFYCAPTVDDRDSWIPTLRHIATEGRCFVLSSCQYATRADYPAEYETSYGDDPTAVFIRGGSAIVDPFGEILAGPVYGKEDVLTAELDLGQIARGKFDLDVAGHYARDDVFDLRVRDGHDE